ncbi:hypothetical protein QOZ80_7AG0569150 [Eleusine coracana subsp. coracana]|nr:hypothetical protein QOZ80_7AG0569150 [Eleusine coracana subsp. coracana]
MEYISPERHLEGSCGDPGPLFGDQDGSLLDHLDYQGGGFQDSLPFMNDQITRNSTKSVSASPEPSLKQAQEPLNIESGMQNDAVEQNVHNSNSGTEMTPVGCDDVQKSPEVIGALLPQELSESTANDASDIQPEATHSDAYHGDSLLTENNSRDSQLNNSGDEDEIPNSLVIQMENEDTKMSNDTSYRRKNGSDDDYMNGRKFSPIDSQDKENFNSTGARYSRNQPEQENPGTRNRSSTPENQFDSPRERFARLERDTPSPDGRGSPERRDTHRKRASPRELSPHAQNDSPVERKRRRESQHGAGSPRRRSASPRRRSTPQRRSASPRRSSHKRRSSPRRDSPRRRDTRRDSPRRKESPRRRDSSRRKDSPKRRDRSKSRSPSRRTDSSWHRREHDRSRSRSPHLRDHQRRSPRRHSPRRRSPPSSHRHHSPKRHWSPPANRKTGLGKPGRNLFVAGFSYATTERDLEKKFAKYGRVTSARVVRDRRTGDSRGFGFLSLEKDEDADAAIRACDETEWNGRIILVEKSKAPTW